MERSGKERERERERERESEKREIDKERRAATLVKKGKFSGIFR